jgi:hypothetical protein
VLAAAWSVLIGSRGQDGHAGASQSHRGLAASEIAVDGHCWPSAGVEGRMTGGVASSVRERRAGEGARPAQSIGPSRREGRPGEREGEESGHRWAARVRVGRARGREG